MTGQGEELVRRLDVAEVGKELAATALIMLALTIGLVGFKMEDISGGTILVTRFGAVAAVIVLAVLGRYALILLRHGRPGLVVAGATPLGIVFLLAIVGQKVLEQGDWLALFLPFSETVVNWLLVIVTFVFAGRGAWAYRRATSTLTAAEREAAADRFGAKVQELTRVLGPALLVIALLFPLLTIWIDPKVMRHPLDIAVLVFTYIMLGWGLNIVVGLAGLLDLGYVAFYAVGAYSYALLAQHFGLGFWVCLPFAGLMAALAGLVLGFPVLRLRGDYLAIVTLGFGEMIRIILLNWYDFTNGPDGISGIPTPTFFGLPLTRATSDGGETFHTFFNIAYSPVDKLIYFYYVIIILALITNAFTLRIRKLPVGRGLGGTSRGRDGLPRPRHQPPQHQADRVCHRRHVRRFRRLLLRRAFDLHQP